jgi:hypothetical protein
MKPKTGQRLKGGFDTLEYDKRLCYLLGGLLFLMLAHMYSFIKSD